MYIQSSKRQDIKKSYSEWKTKYESRRAEYDRQFENYLTISNEFSDKIKDKIYNTFKEYIDAIPGLELKVSTRNHAVVRFRYRPNNEDVEYVGWKYEFYLDYDGDVETYHTTWGNLSLGNLDQADNLLNSAKLIRELLAFNWSDFMLSIRDDIPKEADYVTISDPDYDEEYKNPGYDMQLLCYDLQRAAGKDAWFETTCGDWINILQVDDISESADSGPNITAMIARVTDYDIKCHTESAIYTIEHYKDTFSRHSGLVEYLFIKLPVNIVTSQELIDIVSRYGGQ